MLGCVLAYVNAKRELAVRGRNLLRGGGIAKSLQIAIYIFCLQFVERTDRKDISLEICLSGRFKFKILPFFARKTSLKDTSVFAISISDVSCAREKTSSLFLILAVFISKHG